MQLAKVLERGKSGEDWIIGCLPAFGGFLDIEEDGARS
jgi:hypothetical protein